MPNRVLRDWTDSEKINELSAHAERFFTRLIMCVDDFGCFTANLKLIKSSLFPLLIDEVREADVTRWMAECQKAGIIVLYEVENKQYLQIIDFKQRLRLSKSKYPQPNDGHLTDIIPPETKRSRNEVETEGEGVKNATPQQPVLDESFQKFQGWLNENAPTVAKMKEPFTQEQYLKLLETCSKEEIATLCLKMHNWKDLNKKNTSANLTFKNWYNRDSK